MQLEIHNMIDFAPYPLSVFNSEGELTTANQNWNKLFGIKKGIVYTLTDFKLLERSGLELNIKSIQKSKQPVKTKPVLCERDDLINTKKNINRYYVFHLNNILDSNNKKYTIVMAEDVTEDRKQEELHNEISKQLENSAYILEVLENERKRIAKDLHDVIGQRLIVAKLNLEYYQKQNGESIEELEKTKKEIQEISKEIKMIIQNLHPVIIDKYSLADALKVLIENFSNETEINTQIKFFGDYFNENKNINLNIYRIIQEALNNVAKHSGAAKSSVELHFSAETITGMIEDNGSGLSKNFEKGYMSNLTGYGIISMRERSKACGGDFSLESIHEGGTRVIFNIPLTGTTNEA
ncbi:MAG: sensor histidine kinase [Bacteroidetes bacterium]|nr:sensor histidine kinase [Bacteroidota bacterium]